MRPTKALGQSFLVDPNLARAIVVDAGVLRGERVVEIGAGLGSLTAALAESGATVLAVEFDRSLRPALREVLGSYPNVRLEFGDALRMKWDSLLGEDEWRMVSNLPYSVAVPIVMQMLEGVPQVSSYLVMVQREVGARLVAEPGDVGYGAVSVRVAYRADRALVRRVPPTVFWPRPKVESVLVRLTPRQPSVDVDPAALFRVVQEGFAERRKTMKNALRRLGLGPSDATRIMKTCGLSPDARAETLGLVEFSRLTTALIREGVLEGPS
ncbi:MAG: 16S rRNA (adenine(1518)-N(6)/adenine(1519)-N(6))-dimethyltransferase RsmA [Actinomycetota bacterium]